LVLDAFDVGKRRVLSAGDLAYFRQRQSNHVYEAVFAEFQKSGMSKADVARRLNKKPEQITRWLSGPGNWTLDLLLAVGAEMTFTAVSIVNQPIQNYAHPLVQTVLPTGFSHGSTINSLSSQVSNWISYNPTQTGTETSDRIAVQ
jgi:hypothetical protein